MGFEWGWPTSLPSAPFGSAHACHLSAITSCSFVVVGTRQWLSSGSLPVDAAAEPRSHIVRSDVPVEDDFSEQPAHPSHSVSFCHREFCSIPHADLLYLVVLISLFQLMIFVRVQS